MTENTTQIPLERTEKKREIVNVLLAAIVSFACCLSIPLSSAGSLGNIVGIVTVVLCSIFAVRISSRKILTVILLVWMFSGFGLSGALPIISILLACTVGCGAFAWLISKTESPYLALIPAVAYAVSTVVTKNWFGSLLTLMFILPAIILAQTYEKMTTRVSALLRVSVGYILFIALGIVLSMLYFTGEFRTEIIGEILEYIKTNMVKVLSSIEMTMVNGETHMLMSETDAYNAISLLISLIPALTVTLCHLLAYFAQKIQFSIFCYTEGEREFNDLRKIFIMSPMSAVVFILSFLIYTVAITSDSSAVLSTVTSNLYIIFMPGLAFMGIKSFTSGRSAISQRGCASAIISSLFFVLLLFNTGIAIVMAACFGAYTAIADPIRKYLSKKKK